MDYNSCTHSYTPPTPSARRSPAPSTTLATFHWISTPPTAFANLSQSAEPSNANTSSAAVERISFSSEGRPVILLVAIGSERVAIPDEVEEEFPSPKRERNDRIKPWAPFEDEEDEGMASKPSSLAPALSGADPAAAGVPGAPPPAPVEASRLRSSSRKSDCLALSSARVGERALLLLLLEDGEAVPPEALASEDEPDMSDLVRRIKRGGRSGCRVDWSARSERRTWRCLIDPREKEEIPWPSQPSGIGPRGRRAATTHSAASRTFLPVNPAAPSMVKTMPSAAGRYCASERVRKRGWPGMSTRWSGGSSSAESLCGGVGSAGSLTSS